MEKYRQVGKFDDEAVNYVMQLNLNLVSVDVLSYSNNKKDAF